MSPLATVVPGDVLNMTSFKHVQPGVEVGYSAGRGRVAVFILLGHADKAAPEKFDPEAAIRRLGWVPASEKNEAVTNLMEDLRIAAQTLRRYEELHRAKNTEESTAKAEVNAELASRFEATIAKVEGGAQ